jgi:hypothetical protein
MTGTCQILLEGQYNGVLEPWRHYIPLKNDYSNLEEVMDLVKDVECMQRIADVAYTEIIESGTWSYRNFVDSIERDVIDHSAGRAVASPSEVAVSCWLLCRDRFLWMFVHFEASSIGRYLSLIVQNVWRFATRVKSRLGLT